MPDIIQRAKQARTESEIRWGAKYADNRIE